MAHDLKYAVALKNSRLDQVTAALGASAKIRIYDGSKPAGPGTAVTTQNLLCELICDAGAFAPAASGGVLTANAIPSGTGAAAAGAGTDATWFRALNSAATAYIDGTVGEGGTFDLVLDNSNIAFGQVVVVNSLTITHGN